MKHSFATNPDLEICPPLRRSQNCRWGRQTQPGKSVAITTSTNVTETFDYICISHLHPDSDPDFDPHLHPDFDPSLHSHLHPDFDPDSAQSLSQCLPQTQGRLW